MSVAARRPKLSERVVMAIRNEVLAGAAAPGAKLPTEAQLTARYGVSRTVIREALARLAADGLVEARQGAGVFVREQPSLAFGAISLEVGNRISHALNVLEVRMGLEIESAGLAALRRNSAQEAAIHEAFFECDRALEAREATGRLDFAFHRAIAVATNNPFYVEVIDALGARVIPCAVSAPWGAETVLTPEYQARVQREHHAVLRAISASDSAAAREAMRVHLIESAERYRERLSGQQAGYLRRVAEVVAAE